MAQTQKYIPERTGEPQDICSWLTVVWKLQYGHVAHLNATEGVWNLAKLLDGARAFFCTAFEVPVIPREKDLLQPQRASLRLAAAHSHCNVTQPL